MVGGPEERAPSIDNGTASRQGSNWLRSALGDIGTDTLEHLINVWYGNKCIGRKNPPKLTKACWIGVSD